MHDLINRYHRPYPPCPVPSLHPRRRHHSHTSDSSGVVVRPCHVLIHYCMAFDRRTVKLKVDDDTFIVWPNLLHFLETKDPKTPAYFGRSVPKETSKHARCALQHQHKYILSLTFSQNVVCTHLASYSCLFLQLREQGGVR